MITETLDFDDYTDPNDMFVGHAASRLVDYIVAAATVFQATKLLVSPMALTIFQVSSGRQFVRNLVPSKEMLVGWIGAKVPVYIDAYIKEPIVVMSASPSDITYDITEFRFI